MKRYLNVASLSNDGLLVVKKTKPLASSYDQIIIPRQVTDGLLTALHIQLDHPTSHQLKCVVQRHFFALDLDKCISIVTENCHLCTALKSTPSHLTSQSSEDPPNAVGISYSADVMRRNRQLILVVRESVTSYTASSLLSSETRDDLRDGLIRLCLPLVPLDGPSAVIRTDSAPGFRALTNDELLKHSRITIELGRTKNINKNPVGERAIQELEGEIIKQSPGGGMISQNTLAFATARLNTRIRRSGLSSREMLYQRDQHSNEQIPIVDRDLILDQHSNRSYNHKYSEISKACGKPRLNKALCSIGDLVYIYQDRDKNKARDRYLVVGVDENFYIVKKFVGNQLRKSSYRVKHDECYKVRGSVMVPVQSLACEEDNDDSNIHDLPQPAPMMPDIPTEISQPAVCNDTMLDSQQNNVEEEPPEDVHTENDSYKCDDVSMPRRSNRIRKAPERYGAPVLY